MTQPTRARFNLVLVHTPGWQGLQDFEAIRQQVEMLADDIAVTIVDSSSKSRLTHQRLARRPTLVFSPLRLGGFQPERGMVYQGHPMSKLDEMRWLAEAGLPIPFFEEITPRTVLLEAIYGQLIIIKPSFALASWGQGVELRRTRTVRYRPPVDYPDDHLGRQAPMIAQKFIDCGRAMTCRVLTLFGAPIFTYQRQSQRRMVLDPGRDAYDQEDFMPAPSHSKALLCEDADMLALAAAAYRAMPQVALQACDILRSAQGDLYLLEVNPGGGTWMFSSPNSHFYKERLGIADLAKPFDAWRVCARVLIEKTRAEAV